MILLVGSEGNMASRYKAILKYLGISFLEYDTAIHDVESLPVLADKCDKFLICTPTSKHVQNILHLSGYGKPILCEKPISKDKAELGMLLSYCRQRNINLQMINQYAFTPTGSTNGGETLYNYYKHGTDTLPWDCINISGLAEGDVFLNETSPIWKCRINGKRLDIAWMDIAYIEMIKTWDTDPKPNLEYIETSHNKIFEHLQGGKTIECHSGPNRDPS